MKASKKEEPAGTMEGAADRGDAMESAAATRVAGGSVPKKVRTKTKWGYPIGDAVQPEPQAGGRFAWASLNHTVLHAQGRYRDETLQDLGNLHRLQLFSSHHAEQPQRPL
ncbi:unnamed protein product [Ectocarpus sp. CCAP 1310/34]|nr:unnamed protein product [Ectocarpus sp. CCAP 1310/34]